jgi:hypothetical protein
MFVPAYTEEQARAAVATSLCYSEVLRQLGLRPVGGNHRVLRKWVDEIWRIPTDHFDAKRARVAGWKRTYPLPLEQVLVEGSSYSRSTLKRRLYELSLKQRRCELCGQGERWRGGTMSLILDHINGVPNDNRIENLRIVCPNCAATLETHCGRKNQLPDRQCRKCGARFKPRYRKQNYCSSECGASHGNRHRGPQLQTRKVPRPSFEQLRLDVGSMSMVAVGRKYGVTDNAVRKWLRWYKRQAEREAKDDVPSAGAGAQAA